MRYEKSADNQEKELTRGRAVRRLAQRGQTEAAINLGKRYLDENPKDFEVMSNLGIAYLEAGRIQEADDIFEQSLRLNPRQFRVLMISLRTALKLGKFEEGYQRLDRSEQVDDPNHPGIASSRIWLAMQQKNWNLAEEFFEVAQQRFPNDTVIMHQGITLAMKAGNFDVAESRYVQAVSKFPTDLFIAQIGLESAILQNDRDLVNGRWRRISSQHLYNSRILNLGVYVALLNGNPIDAFSTWKVALTSKEGPKAEHHEAGILLYLLMDDYYKEKIEEELLTKTGKTAQRTNKSYENAREMFRILDSIRDGDLDEAYQQLTGLLQRQEINATYLWILQGLASRGIRPAKDTLTMLLQVAEAEELLDKKTIEDLHEALKRKRDPLPQEKSQKMIGSIARSKIFSTHLLPQPVDRVAYRVATGFAPGERREGTEEDEDSEDDI